MEIVRQKPKKIVRANLTRFKMEERRYNKWEWLYALRVKSVGKSFPIVSNGRLKTSEGK